MRRPFGPYYVVNFTKLGNYRYFGFIVLDSALEEIQEVYEKRCQLLGGRNPETLVAKRELLVTICASESPWKEHMITAEFDIIPLEKEPQTGLVGTGMKHPQRQQNLDSIVL
jgi:hypothetical protein